MKQDGKETLRSIRALRQTAESVVTALMDKESKFDLHRAELIIDAGNMMLKSCVAEIAYEKHQLDMMKKGLKVIEYGDQVGEDGGGEGGEEEETERSAEAGKETLAGT